MHIRSKNEDVEMKWMKIYHMYELGVIKDAWVFQIIMIGRGFQPEIVTTGAGWVREFEKVVELQWTKAMDNIETVNKFIGLTKPMMRRRCSIWCK